MTGARMTWTMSMNSDDAYVIAGQFFFIFLIQAKNVLKFLHHHPKSPEAVETEHPKRVNKERKFKIAPGTLDLGSPV